mmetsp:Transcript_14105/g.15596  ORF Transcript_14105/g.15596 Transcript_14105/m.15596 type:complete len:598 (-) Transcript_14105:73-1866(-)
MKPIVVWLLAGSMVFLAISTISNVMLPNQEIAIWYNINLCRLVRNTNSNDPIKHYVSRQIHHLAACPSQLQLPEAVENDEAVVEFKIPSNLFQAETAYRAIVFRPSRSALNISISLLDEKGQYFDIEQKYLGDESAALKQNFYVYDENNNNVFDDAYVVGQRKLLKAGSSIGRYRYGRYSRYGRTRARRTVFGWTGKGAVPPGIEIQAYHSGPISYDMGPMCANDKGCPHQLLNEMARDEFENSEFLTPSQSVAPTYYTLRVQYATVTFTEKMETNNGLASFFGLSQKMLPKDPEVFVTFATHYTPSVKIGFIRFGWFIGMALMVAAVALILNPGLIPNDVTKYRNNYRKPFPSTIPGFGRDEVTSSHRNKSFKSTNAPESDKSSITHLTYESNDLLRIQVKGFTRLLRLNVRNNDLKELKLSHPTLRWINAATNDISAFVSSNKMPYLEWLNLSDNDIEEIDDNSFEQCRRLRFLNIASNDIRSLNVSGIPSLTWLDAHNNDIIDIQGLNTATNLECLDLSTNDLKRAPDMRSCQRLKYLNLANNDIDNIDTLCDIISLPCIEILDIRNNDLTDDHVNTLKRLLRDNDKQDSVLVV